MKGKFISLLLRFFLLVLVSVLYFRHSSLLDYPLPFFERLLPLHLLWVFFMVFFISRIFGNKHGMSASNRRYAKFNEIVPEYNKDKLSEFVKKNNLKALGVLLLALVVNTPFWVMYIKGIIDERFLFVLFIVFFFLDIVCETVYCPFQRVIMKNRCCHVCRIYSWNSILTIAPLFVIPGFFSASLSVVGLIDLIIFEIKYKRHPEYFWDGSNATLRCANCKMKLCVIRGKQPNR